MFNFASFWVEWWRYGVELLNSKAQLVLSKTRDPLPQEEIAQDKAMVILTQNKSGVASWPTNMGKKMSSFHPRTQGGRIV